MWMVLTKARIVGKKHAGNISGNRFHYLLFHDGRADQGPRAAAPVLERLGPVFGKHHEILCAKSDLQICRCDGHTSQIPPQVAGRKVLMSSGSLVVHAFGHRHEKPCK